MTTDLTPNNPAIRDRMRSTGQTFEQVLVELRDAQAAAERYRTGNLTEEDRREIRRCTRDFYDRGGHCWRGR